MHVTCAIVVRSVSGGGLSMHDIGTWLLLVTKGLPFINSGSRSSFNPWEDPGPRIKILVDGSM